MSIEVSTQPGTVDFSALFYANPQPMWVFDVETLHILDANEAALRIYGYDRQELLQMDVLDLSPPQDRTFVEHLLPSMRRDREVHYRDMRHITKSGVVIQVTIVSYHMEYKGRVARVIYARSIDDRKELAGRLILTQRKLLHILESTVIGFVQLDPDWNIVYWNKAAEDLIGYQRVHVMGRNLWDVLPEMRHSDLYEQFERTMLTHKPADVADYYWPRQRWFQCHAYPIGSGIIVHFMDITHKRLSRWALMEKVDQLKEISFINSHSLRKPVASLIGLTHLVSDGIIPPDEYSQINVLIKECVAELDEVVKDVNRRVSDEDHFQILEHAPGVFNFGRMVDGAVKEVELLYRPSPIIIKNNIYRDHYGICQSIELALMYLIDNAARYSKPGTPITIETQIMDQNIVLSVTDEGRGMTADQVREQFERMNQMRGISIEMGLPKISEICRRHNGSMWLESTPGVGTSFYLRFPLSNVAQYIVSGHTDFSVYQDPGVKVTFDRLHCFTRADWASFHNKFTIRDGCELILSHITTHNNGRLLNVNKNVVGGWLDACDWLVNDWFPIAEAAGLKYLAWVTSPSTFSKLSAQYMMRELRSGIVAREFDNEADAIAWLNSIT